MVIRTLPSRERVCQLLDYDPVTGVLIWRPRPIEEFSSLAYGKARNTRRAGKAAGSLTAEGYLEIKLDGRSYLAHRIVWLIVHGDPVPPELDHRDRDKTNNRIANLRPATRAQNMTNVAALRTNKLGVKGVHFDKRRGRFIAQIIAYGRQKRLGRFKTLEEATMVYRAASLAHKGEFAP